MTEYPRTEDIICEAIVREISLASRWCAIEEAWKALLHVRQMRFNLRSENTHLSPTDQGKTQAPEGGERAETQWDGIEHKHRHD